MSKNNLLLKYSIEWPKTVTALMVIMTILLGALIMNIQVDTDPENMLSEDEAVRVFHNQVKKTFDLQDVVVLGIVNENDPDGVFNPATLKKVHELTEFAKTLSDPNDPEKHVVSQNILAPGTVDAIEQAGMGQVSFNWLMKEPPQTREESHKIRDLAMNNPLLKGTLVSEDGKALAIYIPISKKDYAYQVRSALQEKIEDYSGKEQYHITGLPVAEDTFGVEMFIQMAISAPLAMIMIFILMFIFFKNLKLITAPMIIAMATVISTMGLLIGTGNTVHIMSSMIPIFLMPIAVVDSVHILSEFFDLYQQTKNRRATLEKVMGHLFRPMFFTSVTSATGFASLALTPIPPVRTFGLFVAFGIMLAWFLTIVFIPAYISLLSEKSLNNFGTVVAAKNKKRTKKDYFNITKPLRWLGDFTYYRAKFIATASLIILIIAAFGIMQIEINDNPIKWFAKDHEVRVADRVLNEHFGGTHEAYLILTNGKKQSTVGEISTQVQKSVSTTLTAHDELLKTAQAIITNVEENAKTADVYFSKLNELWESVSDDMNNEDYDLWLNSLDALQSIRDQNQIFKNPEVLNYIDKLEDYMLTTGIVGKSNSVTDIVKKVHQELYAGDEEKFSVPETQNGVAQTLISLQSSHNPDDLWHLVTPDYSQANIWVQLKNGNNKDMEITLAGVDKFFKNNPPPVEIDYKWAGLTYINVVWQDKMVKGMLNSFLSSFLVVLILMSILFRSVLWGLLAMVPLSITIAIIYALIGFIGKDYDMPVAILSSLTLGLAIDFAIHFLERTREIYKQTGSWEATSRLMFEEPARAITRNVIVIAIGFTPLLLAPLVPYQTVGIFLASIMAISGLATIVILPALINILKTKLFKGTSNRKLQSEIDEQYKTTIINDINDEEQLEVIS
ncbi:MAG: MMPL family transporter [Fibrobacteria bacterium]|nr:MMPL family transporter [Fibrobacteria bacterium]